MDAEVTVTLCHGLWKNDERQVAARVRALTGAEEALLADLATAATPAERATAVLAAAVTAVGDVEPVLADDVRAIAIGDRETLLAAVHRLTFGPRFEAVVRCPAAECGTVVDLDVGAGELRLPAPAALPQRAFAIGVSGEDGELSVRFRLPTGADQEAAARLAAVDPRAAGEVLLDRCVLEIVDARGQPVDVASVAGRVRASLEEAIRTLDPGIETILGLTCPGCGREVKALLDFAAFLLGELATGETIFRQVDRIARAYHWSEADILAMPLSRRRRYLTLIADEELAA